MILVLAYSDRDISQALRLMHWIGWLSSQNGNSMLEENILLVASQRAARTNKHRQICWLAAKIFREARCLVPDTEQEKGWPSSANFMFSEGLKHVEQFFQSDIFFLEPDGIPLVPEWYDRIQAEWEVARQHGKSFMGAYVPHNVSHMTGIAVYGANWREVAPQLVSVPDNDAFDCYGAPGTVPNAHFVPLIQHVFKRHDANWEVPALGILDRRAVVFHQDKRGKLIYLLDQAVYGGECAAHPIFGYTHLSSMEKVMRKFYYALNATRVIKTNGGSIAFSPLEPFGGSIPGVYETEIETEQLAMDDVTRNPASGVSELSQEEWENVTKKKAPVPSTNISERLNGTLPQVPLIATPSRSPAVLVAEPVASVSETGLKPDLTIKDINDVLKVGPVTPSQIPPVGPASKRPRKPTGNPAAVSD